MTQIQDLSSAPIRSLSDAEFEARYDCDRFTASVLSSRLRYVSDHMSTGLLHRAFSPIISLAMDFAGGITGPRDMGYPLVAVNAGLIVFISAMPDAVKNAVEEYGPERLKKGDLLIVNDPHRAGNHCNDITFVQPLFHEDSSLGYVTMRCHQLDMGAVVAGGFAGYISNTFEGGLVMGPRLLYQSYEPVRETFSLILDNVRYGSMLLPDLRTTYQCCLLGEQLITETVERYGTAAYLGTLRYNCDAAAEAMTRGIEEYIPDGEYTGEAGIDCDASGDDEEFTIRVKIRKMKGRVEVDFSGTSRQALSAINCTALDARTAAAVGLKLLVEPETPFTSGALRPVDIVVPPGSIVSALPPDGSVTFYWEVEGAIFTAVLEALRDVLGPHAIGGDYGSTVTHNAQGRWDDGTEWMSTAECGPTLGPWGGDMYADGDSYTGMYLLNLMAPATETVEHTVPVMFMKIEYAADTAGPGQHRGGAAHVRDLLWLRETEHYPTPYRYRRATGIGVNGGQPGRLGGAWIFKSSEDGRDVALLPSDDSVYQQATPVAGVLDPETNLPSPDGGFVSFARHQRWLTAANTLWRYRGNGAGGWGSPLDRDPEQVMRDVRDGYVSSDGAKSDYGVVVIGDPHLHPERLLVDAAATNLLRAELRRARP